MKKTRLPNCLVVGPQKAGTTWISDYLKSRGDVRLPDGVKETFFFDRYFKKGLAWYEKHFSEIDPDSETQIEVGPTYFECTDAISRVLDTLGKSTTIVCTFRDPAARTFSLYQHMRRYGMTRLEFRDAVSQLKIHEGSLYAGKITQWYQTFGHDNVKVLIMDDLVESHDRFARQLCEHLDLEFVEVPERLKEKSNAAAPAPNYWVAKATNTVAQVFRSLRLYSVVNVLKKTPLKKMVFGDASKTSGKPRPQLSNEDRKWLLDTWFRADITKLESILDRKFCHWKSE